MSSTPMESLGALSVGQIAGVARAAKSAAGRVGVLSTQAKDALLLDLSERLLAQRAEILEANDRDVATARQAGLPGAKLARLTLTGAAIEQLAEGLRQIAGLADPVGEITSQRRVASGLLVRRVRCPLGVVCMIYEARPGVTIDAFALCFKAGNACILKGGREAAASNALLAGIVRGVLAAHGLPVEAITPIITSDRAVVLELLQQRGLIDLVIPRGGEELISWVAQHSRVPTIQHDKGVNHIYVDLDADLAMAQRVVLSAKTSAPATCNAAECVLVHEGVAGVFVPAMLGAFAGAGVQVRGDVRVLALAGGRPVVPAVPGDFGREFLDLIVAMKVVGSMDEAIEHIGAYGSNHTEAIITANAAAAGEFLGRVHASCVLHNASTRMNDGSALGLGAEIGISTSRLHAYGPMGLEELTTRRFVCTGDGQTR